MTRKPRATPDTSDAAAFDPAEAVSIKQTHVGSDFYDFLAEDGILEEVQATALKRVIAFQIERDMRAKGMTKVELANRMQTSRSQLDRILDPEVTTIQLDLIIRAAQCVGRRFSLTIA